MLKKGIVLFVLLMLTGCEKTKIAFVDATIIGTGYVSFIDHNNQAQAAVNEFVRSRDSITNAFNVEVQAYERSVAGLTKQQNEEKRKSLIQKNEQIQQYLRGQEQRLQATNQQKVQEITQRVGEFIAEYAEENGYSFVLSKSGNGTDVFYGSPSHDITEEVLNVLNTREEEEKTKTTEKDEVQTDTTLVK